MPRSVIRSDDGILPWALVTQVGAKGDPGATGGGSAITDGDRGDITVASSGTSWTVEAGAINDTKLANNAVTTAKITDANVTSAKLATNAVTTAKITDANVTTAKIADDAVTAAKIADSDASAIRTLLDVVANAAATAGTALSRAAGVTGNLIELVNGSLVVYARNRLTGQKIVNGVNAKEILPWTTGDPDPTANAALPSHVIPHLILGASDSEPAWVSGITGPYLVTQETDEVAPPPPAAVEWQWTGTGLADEATVTSGSAGTGDDSITSVSGAPTVETGETVTPAVEFAASGTAVYLVGSVTAGTERRDRFFMKTPAAWPASTTPVMDYRNSSTLCARFSQAGSSAAGVFRLTNSGNANTYSTPVSTLSLATWYRVETWINQDATATNGTAGFNIYNMAGTLIHSSGDVTDATGTPVGYGTTHNAVWHGVTANSLTMTSLQGKFKVTNDSATEIGAS